MKTSTKGSSRGETLRLWAASLFVLVAGVLFTLAPGGAHAAPAAGTVIGNQASATYVDAGNTARTATSNLVQTTVAQVKSFTLTANGARNSAPGNIVYYPHTITNTGNGVDTYTLVAPTSTSFVGPPNAGPHTALAYYADANGDGLPDNATPINTSGAIAAGGVFRFVVAGTVPANAANNDTANIVVTVNDTGANTASNTDTTTVATSVVNVTKALSPVTSGASPNAGPLTVTLAYTNSGTAAATNLVLTDVLPAGMVYNAGSGRWSVSGATALTDVAGGDPAGIDYAAVTVAGPPAVTTVTVTIANVPAGFSGNVTFTIQIAPNLAPQFLNNTASFRTDQQTTAVNTNTASYQVLRTASVVANGSITSSANNTNEPVTQLTAAAGSAVLFTNVIWNLGNAADTFVISTAPTPNWPAGTVFTLLQSDGVTNLVANTTPSIPLFSGGTCPAPFVADTTAQRCGYRVILRAQLPANATNAGAPFSVTKTATSSFDNTKTDTVIDTLQQITTNTVDLTNNTARSDSSPAGTATAANAATTGFGANSGVAITTNTVTPLTSGTTTTRFVLYVNNTGAVNDSFNLSVAGTPAGWAVQFRNDGGVGAACSTVGAAITGTGVVNAGANRVVCAEVTVPQASTGQAAPGTYNLDFTATSASSGTVSDTKRDAVTVNSVSSVTLVPPNTQVTFPGASVTYTHTITNNGNVVAEAISFQAGFLSDSRSAQGWTSTAYVDSNGNGVLDPGVDDVPANLVSTSQTFNLAPGASRAIFVRVFAPISATGADPANVTTLTARYNGGASSVSVTDTTSVTDGLVLIKRQRTAACDGSSFGAYTIAAIPAGPATAPGQCIGYEIVATNSSPGAITQVVLSDPIPPNTKQHNACGAPAATAGTVSSPGNGNTGTITVSTVPAVPGLTIASGASVTLTFCVRIDP